MGGGIREIGSAALPPRMSVGSSNSLGVYQKNGRHFFKLSDIAGTAPAQRGAGSSSVSGVSYNDTVSSIKGQIQASLKSRSLIDRIRDPHNHTAKTQILQLVQLAAKEGPDGPAKYALVQLIISVDTDRPERLFASALASAMGGAPWVAQRNTKIADGVLNTATLAADAARYFSIQGDFCRSSRLGVEIRKQVAQQAFTQLKKHGALENANSSFWQGLRALDPQERLKFLQVTKTCDASGGSFGLKPGDIMAGKLNARSEESWDAMLKARPIGIEGLSAIANYQDLGTQILDSVSAVHFREYRVQAPVGRLKNAKDLTNALNTLQTIAARIEVCRYDAADLPKDSSAASVWRELNERAQTFGVPPPMRIPDAPRADAIAFMQRQALDALKGMYRFIPYTAGGANLRYPNLEERYRDVSSVGQSIQEQLAEAIQRIRENIDTRSASGTENRGLSPFDKSTVMAFLRKAEEISGLTPENLPSPARVA